MKKALYLLAALIPLIALTAVFTHITGARANTPNCIQTGFVRDTINLTAALINPTGTVTGPVNGTGCNIVIYYGPGSTGTIKNAELYGANYYGVVNNGGTVTITKSKIHDIGEVPFNGDQHGVSVYFAYDSGAKGSISTNLIWNYQKGGIVVNGPSDSATVSHNTVLGQGPISYIAQNGIQIGYGAKATVSNNYVSGNSYTGSAGAASGGIIVVGGSCYQASLTIGTKITNNTVRGNDIGIWLSNIDVDPNNPNNCVPTLTPTKVIVSNDVSSNDAVNNTSGAGPGAGYQAGITDQGDLDQITNNQTCGVGYTPVTPPPYLYMIDDTSTNNPVESNNTFCNNSSSSAPHLVHAKGFGKVSVVR